MDSEQLRDYISKYKNSYSKEAIVNQLLSYGIDREDIEVAYYKLDSRPSNSKDRPESTFLILISLVVFFTLIGLLVYFLIP